MAHTDQLEVVAEQLGYRATSGYVDGSAPEVGARDFVWRDLREKCQVDAAYFRGGVPLVAFAGVDSRQDINAVHRRLWNFGQVPVLIAATPREVAALSCVMPPALGRDADAPILRTARPQQSLSHVLGEFTRYNVESGRAAAAHRDRFDPRLRVDHNLLVNLRQLRLKLLRSNLDVAGVEQLLSRSIFIRYLEDRGVLSEERLLELGSFQSFTSALEAGPAAVAQLFNALSNRFNGDLFKPSEAEIPSQAIADLNDFFNGTDLAAGQPSFWPYDFGVIPTELISSIYEQLLADTQREDATYYTPRPVVDLVLDELLPWTGGTAQPTILDPACGSGIFLAEAFRRLVYRQAIANGQPAEFNGLVSLLTESIHGVDINQAAIGVTALSLYLALLEHIDSSTVWREVRLPTLANQNLVVSDFFEDHDFPQRGFDLVVGNPPWRSTLTPAADAYVRRERIRLPDRQIAHAFLWRAVELTSEGGATGLVLPAKSLLHNRSNRAEVARRHIFNELNVETVVDLSPLRRETFATATEPASVAIIRGHRSNQEPSGTVHVSPRRTPLATTIDGIVVSQENMRHVPQALAGTTTTVWKAYLWGGPADLDLVTRLRETFPSLKAVADKNNWLSGQGFQVRGGDENDATEIVGMTLIPVSSVGPMHLAPTRPEVVTDAIMHRPRDPRIYKGPHVIMRKGFRDYPVSVFLETDAAFTDGLFALAGSSQDSQELRVVSGLLNSSVARYWFFITSSSWGVEREQIQLNEYLSLPIPPVEGEIRERIIGAVELAARQPSPASQWMDALDPAVFRAYGLTSSEQDLVRDGLTLRLDEYRHGPESIAYRPPVLRDFATYCRLISSYLNATDSIQWTAELIERSTDFAVVVCKARGAGIPESTALFSLDRLMAIADVPLDGWRSPAVVMQPSVIVVEETNVYLVKPNERRCWGRSNARTDAGEVLSAILMAAPSGEE